MNLKPKHRSGRPMRLGRWVLDEKRGFHGYFIGYCSDCDTRVIIARQDYEKLLGTVRSTHKTRRERMFGWLLRSRLL